ncbi:hypothetical protein [Streptomyces axinellae]|uniref:Uncharacterized protein n=1 Tax=Streptomyces axinellae TaxID=552788 RepID=A0ABN3QAK3_9ACTN
MCCERAVQAGVGGDEATAAGPVRGFAKWPYGIALEWHAAQHANGR